MGTPGPMGNLESKPSWNIAEFIQHYKIPENLHKQLYNLPKEADGWANVAAMGYRHRSKKAKSRNDELKRMIQTIAQEARDPMSIVRSSAMSAGVAADKLSDGLLRMLSLFDDEREFRDRIVVNLGLGQSGKYRNAARPYVIKALAFLWSATIGDVPHASQNSDGDRQTPFVVFVEKYIRASERDDWLGSNANDGVAVSNWLDRIESAVVDALRNEDLHFAHNRAIHEFFRACLRGERGSRVSQAQMFGAYKKWCKSKERSSLNGREFLSLYAWPTDFVDGAIWHLDVVLL